MSGYCMTAAFDYNTYLGLCRQPIFGLCRQPIFGLCRQPVFGLRITRWDYWVSKPVHSPTLSALASELLFSYLLRSEERLHNLEIVC